MAVYVGSARGDENGAAHGGKAGDQNCKEVSTQKWYKHKKGWRVIRAKDRYIALKIAAAMEAACKNDNIGYDQWQRATLYAAVKDKGFDPALASVACETDCSSLVLCCVAYAFGNDIITPILNGSRWSTANMCSFLVKTGEFVEMTGSQYTDSSDMLAAGDILCTKTQGHTVVVLDDGVKYCEVKTYALGDRTLSEGDYGDDVKELQQYLIRLGYDCGRYGADGEFGSATESALIAFQTDYNLDADGEFGTLTYVALTGAVKDDAGDNPSADPQCTVAGGDITVTGGSVWLWSAPPAAGGAKTVIAHKGDKLQSVDQSNYIPVLLNGNIYWANPKYVQKG